MPLNVNHALMDFIRMEQPALHATLSVLNAQVTQQLALLALKDST